MSFSCNQLPLAFNVAKYFLEQNAESGLGANAAFYYHDRVLTHDQVYHSVRRAAGLFADLEVDCEQRIAILLPDSPELVFSFWGAIWAGCVPVPINTAYTVDDIRYIISDSRARLLVTTQGWYSTLAPLPAQFLRHVVRVDDQPSMLSLLESATKEPEAMTTCRDEPAFWLYTSGSTGRPKGVIHAHRDMVVCAEHYAKQTLGLRATDISYSVAKIPFAYGLGNTLYMPMAVNGSAVLSDASNAFEIIADIHRFRPTVFWAIPATYSSLLALSEISPLDPSSLRLCVSAAEQLPESIWRAFHERYGIEICEGIGTTELLHIFLSNRPGVCRPGSSGQPVSGYQVRVLDAHGKECPPGQVGDLEVTGESLMLGYWNRYDETRQALRGSTMRTGDKYVVDQDGYFRFVGRGDDLFKVSGQWVSPMEVEDILLEHPDVLDCAVVPEPSQDHELLRVTAYVVPKQGYGSVGTLPDQLRRLARDRLPHYKAPRNVRIVSTVPRTATGKVDRAGLRRLHETWQDQ